jgi:hypothetical protein
MRQHRVAERETVPVRRIDTGQIIEYACVNFGQLRSSWDPVEGNGGNAESVLREQAGSRIPSDYWRWVGPLQAL